VKLARQLVAKPWGRTLLPPGFPDTAGRRVGEIIHGVIDGDGGGVAATPVIAKHIFTSERLSIQVHPDDRAAVERGLVRGKTECWLVVDADPGATLALGTTSPLNGADLRAAALDGSIEGLMRWRPVHAGDFFHVPAGTVHAIGAGIALVEIQQNIDATYRLYDYGRQRELHLDDAIAVAEAQPYDDGWMRTVGDVDMPLAETPHFSIGYHAGAGRRQLGQLGKQVLILPIAGEIEVDGIRAGVGDCLLTQGGFDLVTAIGSSALSAHFDVQENLR
jgi:mannose-6-phosphate isomerase